MHTLHHYQVAHDQRGFQKRKFPKCRQTSRIRRIPNSDSGDGIQRGQSAGSDHPAKYCIISIQGGIVPHIEKPLASGTVEIVRPSHCNRAAQMWPAGFQYYGWISSYLIASIFPLLKVSSLDNLDLVWIVGGAPVDYRGCVASALPIGQKVPDREGHCVIEQFHIDVTKVSDKSHHRAGYRCRKSKI